MKPATKSFPPTFSTPTASKMSQPLDPRKLPSIYSGTTTPMES